MSMTILDLGRHVCIHETCGIVPFWEWYKEVGVRNVGGSVFEIDLGDQGWVQVYLFQLGVGGPIVMARASNLGIV